MRLCWARRCLCVSCPVLSSQVCLRWLLGQPRVLYCRNITGCCAPFWGAHYIITHLQLWLRAGANPTGPLWVSSASFKSCSSRRPLLASKELATVIHPSMLGTRAKRCLWRSIAGCWWLEPALRRRCQPETCLLTALLEPAAGRGQRARRRAGFDLAAGT